MGDFATKAKNASVCICCAMQSENICLGYSRILIYTRISGGGQDDAEWAFGFRLALIKETSWHRGTGFEK